MEEQLEQMVDSVINLLGRLGRPLTYNEIAQSLRIKKNSIQFSLLHSAITMLMQQGLVLKSGKRKYTLSEATPTVLSGVISIRDGKGVVETNNAEIPKISIKQQHLNTAFDGDTVNIKLIASDAPNRYQGEVTNIVNRVERKIAGKIESDGDFFYLVPDDSQYDVDFLVPRGKLNNAKVGDKVIANFLRWENAKKNPYVEVIELVGACGDPAVEFDAIVREFNLPGAFTDVVMNQTKQVAVKPDNAEIARRLDLRKEEIITIDPADARDFDDAVSLKQLDNGNVELGVHIADVSHYVQAGTPLDLEALRRGNSTYLVDRVIPMLPEELSNNMCSLNPNRVRLAYSVIMELDANRDVVDYQIRETVIKSVRRFSYEEVQDIIDKKEGEFLELILALNKLTQELRAKRFENGGIDFKTSEVRFELDKNKMPISANLKTSIPSTQLIEECMLLANKTVAEHIDKISKLNNLPNPLPFLYRIHAEPLPEKLNSSLEMIKMMQVKSNFVINSSKDINNILASLEGKPEESIVNQILVRSMPKAEYDVNNIGHFGLGFSEYSHFTSPIRRYPDLLIHRFLKEYGEGIPDKARVKFLEHYIAGIGEHCTETERISMDAERASSKLAQTMLAERNMGEEFNGTITGVTDFGIFVTMDEIFAEGLVYLKDIYDDFYIFDEKRMRIVGKRKKKVFSFGKRIRVKIVYTNIDKRRIDLMYITDRIDDEKK